MAPKGSLSSPPYSLLPWPMHPKVAKDCIAHKTDMVTASYCTDAMRALHKVWLLLL